MEEVLIQVVKKTIELPPSPGAYPCFTVTDLTKDERFNLLPFVTRSPFFRFYAGTPLTTKRGVNIGSLFIIDNKPRPRLSAGQEEFLGTIAMTVMKHMEINSEAEERKRAMRMSRGLNAFVEGKSRFDLEDYTFDTSALNSSHVKKRDSRVWKEHSSDSQESQIASDLTAATTKSSGTNTPSDEVEDSGDESEKTTARRSADLGHRSTFVRAANLLRESLDLRDRGGVAFLDTSIGFRGRDNISSDNSMAPTGNYAMKLANENDPSAPDEVSKVTYRHSNFGGDVEDRSYQKKADVLSFSISEGALSPTTTVTSVDSFSPLNEDLLQSFLRRYPRGKLWSFDEDGNLSSSEEEPPRNQRKPSDSRITKSSAKRKEAEILRKHFPNVRQLLFAPLWDASSARWFSGCFVWGTSPRQVFSEEAELNFLIAFGNSVMAEVSRLASISADRQKGDFIGSISHELRSPLHGILASAEFLGETDIDNFQHSLVSVVNSCSRTLLDTINHILDFSKINSFERNWRNIRKPRAGAARTNSTASVRASAKRTIHKEAPPLMNIYARIDVAAVTEEVVEGAYAGQVYQDINSAEFVDFSSDAKGRGSTRGGNRSLNTGTGGEQLAAKEIEVILDIAPDDYTFTTQPGALRRVSLIYAFYSFIYHSHFKAFISLIYSISHSLVIVEVQGHITILMDPQVVMNILGNALKYTQKGMIVVKMGLDKLPSNAGAEEKNERILEIKITDTGKGISSEYLRTSLYTRMSNRKIIIYFSS